MFQILENIDTSRNCSALARLTQYSCRAEDEFIETFNLLCNVPVDLC
jgi:hypothetical protein